MEEELQKQDLPPNLGASESSPLSCSRAASLVEQAGGARNTPCSGATLQSVAWGCCCSHWPSFISPSDQDGKSRGSGSIFGLLYHMRCLQTCVEHLGTLCCGQAGTAGETSSKNLQILIAKRDPRHFRRGSVGGSHLLMCQVSLWRNYVSWSPELWIRSLAG